MRTNRDDIYVNPLTAIRLFNKTYISIREKIFSDKRYKVTREAWIASMFLFGLSKREQRDWFLRPNPRDETPDFYSCSFKEESYVVRETRQLEVFEWRKESSEVFLTALKRKIKNLHAKSITVICYLRKAGNIGNVRELSEKVQKIKINVMDLWCLASVKPKESHFALFQIYPSPFRLNDTDYDLLLKEREKVSFVKPYRGKREDLKFEPLGKKVLLTPEFQFEEIE